MNTTRRDKIILFDADKLRNLRINQGITKTELEIRSDLSRGHICRLESGKIDIPDIQVVWKLAEYFKVDMKEFIKQN